MLHSGSIVECLPVGQIEQARHPATLALLEALPVPPGVLLDYFGAEADRLIEAK